MITDAERLRTAVELCFCSLQHELEVGIVGVVCISDVIPALESAGAYSEVAKMRAHLRRVLKLCRAVPRLNGRSSPFDQHLLACCVGAVIEAAATDLQRCGVREALPVAEEMFGCLQQIRRASCEYASAIESAMQYATPRAESVSSNG